MAQNGEINQLRAAIAHFRSRGNEYHPRYDTMLVRAERIRNCAGVRGLSDAHEELLSAILQLNKPTQEQKRKGILKALKKGLYYASKGALTYDMVDLIKVVKRQAKKAAGNKKATKKSADE